MTRYVETFHHRNGASVPGDVLPINELTPRWGIASSADYRIEDATMGSSAIEQWALTLQKDVYEGLDYRFLYMESSVAANVAAVSLTRAPDFVDGSVAARFGVSFQKGGALVLRGSGTAGSPTTASGYVATIFYNSVFGTGDGIFCRIYKYVNGAMTLLGESTDFVPSSELDELGLFSYILNAEFKANGDELSVTVWGVNKAKPSTPLLTVMDSSITTAGWAGAGVASGSSSDSGKTVAMGFVSVSDDPDEECYIPKNRDERRAFLENPSEVAVALFEAGVLGSSDSGTTGVDAFALISNTGFITDGGDVPANTAYPSRITQIGEFSQTLGGDDFTGHSSQSFGDIVVHNTNGSLDHWLRWNWTGRPFRLLLGSKEWKKCDFVLVARGTIDRLEQRSRTEFVFKLRDGSNVLSRKLRRGTVGGSTSVNAEKPAPLTLGSVFNIRPTLVDPSTFEYKWHDGAVSGVLEVREGGNPISGSPGSIHSQDLANGTFRLSAKPSADISLDGQSDDTAKFIFGNKTVSYGSGNDPWTYAFGHGAMFKLLAYVYSDLEVDQVYIRPALGPVGDYTLALFDHGNGATAGLHISSDEDPSVLECMNRVVQSAFGASYWNAWGELTARGIDLSSAYGEIVYPEGFVIELQEAHLLDRKLSCKRLIPPAHPRKFYYRKNYFLQSNLVGSVEAEDRERFITPGSLMSYDPSFSGLDQPDNHIGARELDHRVTLLYNHPTENPPETPSVLEYTVPYRENHSITKTVGIFEFETRAFFAELEIMRTVDLVHSRYGFENGVRGLVVGLRRNFKSRVATVQVAVQLPGSWPSVTSAYPYVGSGEFE